MSAPSGAPYSGPKKTNVSHNAPLSETCIRSSARSKLAMLIVSLAARAAFVCCDDPAVRGRHFCGKKRGGRIPELCKEAMRCLSRDRCRVASLQLRVRVVWFHVRFDLRSLPMNMGIL